MTALSMSFVIQSAAIWANSGLRIKPPESLAQFSTGSTLGVPNVAWVALALTVAA
jgi:ribose transport system permease protein